MPNVIFFNPPVPQMWADSFRDIFTKPSHVLWFLWEFSRNTIRQVSVAHTHKHTECSCTSPVKQYCIVLLYVSVVSDLFIKGCYWDERSSIWLIMWSQNGPMRWPATCKKKTAFTGLQWCCLHMLGFIINTSFLVKHWIWMPSRVIIMLNDTRVYSEE